MSTEGINYTLPDTDEVVDFIDEGGYGKVFVVEHFGEKLARKEVKYNNKDELKANIAFYEIDFLKKLKHKNIVELKDSYIDADKNTIYIYTKYYKKGDLLKLIKEKRKKRESFSFPVFFI